MHGHEGAGSGVVFVAMWTLMMAAMMLPSMAPLLLRSRRPLVLAAGYLAVWAALGAAIHIAGLVRSLPLVGGAVVVIAGVLQLTSWKAHHLRCMLRAADACDRQASVVAAWRLGLRLGVHCVCSCAGPTAVLLVVGVMDLRAMAVLTAVITAERLAPAGVLVARAAGAAAIVAAAISLT